MSQDDMTVISSALDQMSADAEVIAIEYANATSKDKARISALIRRLQAINAVEELRLQNLENIREQSGRPQPATREQA